MTTIIMITRAVAATATATTSTTATNNSYNNNAVNQDGHVIAITVRALNQLVIIITITIVKKHESENCGALAISAQQTMSQVITKPDDMVRM